VAWAEVKLEIVSESDEDLSDEDMLLNMLGYIGACDTPDLPLTWQVLSHFLQ
jgi:hypothetical protein